MNKVTQLPIEQPSIGGRTRNPSGQTPDTSASGDVGGDLRAARLRRGDDLADIARALKLRRDQLAAIEEGRLDDLPGRTYAMGFVRSYAEYLGLNPAEYVERFKEDMGAKSDPAPLRGLPEDFGENRLPYGWFLMALLVLGVVGYAGYHLVRSAQVTSSLQQPVAPVPAVMTAETARHAPVPKLSVLSSKKAAAGPTAAASSANSAIPAPAIGSAPNPVPPSVALPPGQTFGLQNKNARVVLRAKAITHVVVEGPGGRVYINRILHPGDAYRVPDLVGLSLTTPDGGAVLLELDGQDMGVAGHTGQVTEALPLDPQAIVDRAHGANPG